jgi:anti-sigma-K factor RskA
VTEAHERIVDDLAAYVLGSLEAGDRLRGEADVATCPTCTSLVSGYHGVMGMLPAGLEPVAPPETAWQAIQAGARRRRPRRSVSLSVLPRWLRIARWPAAAAVVAVLVFWNVMLQWELTRRAPGPAPGPEVEALSRRPGRIVILQGTGKPGASARIFVAVDGGGHLAVSGLSPLPRERTYQLWFVRTGSPAVTGATFGVDATGRAWVKVAVPPSLDDVEKIAITEEPSPQGSAPSGKHLLDALPWK